MEKERNILKLSRALITAGAILSPFMGDLKAEASNAPDYARVTGYYCRRIVGYPGYDMGGFCGKPALGGETISGITAACGASFKPHSRVIIEGYPNPILCNDTGRLAPNQIDIFFYTDKELHDAGLPMYSKVYEIE